MPQGASYAKKKLTGKAEKAKVNYSHKRSSKKYTKKGNPTVEIRRRAGGFKKNGGKPVTGFINQNIEEIMASRVIASGSSLAMQDVKKVGKDRLREQNRQVLSKKKTRCEQKLKELQDKVTESQ